LGVAASVLVGVVAVGRAAFAWSVWTYYLDADGGKLSYYAARDVRELLDFAFWSGFLLITASAAVFLSWLWRARVNAELICTARHRRGREWVVWSWFCLGANLWYPFMVMDDVYRASRPDTPANASNLRDEAPGSNLLGLWGLLWAALLCVTALELLQPSLPSTDPRQAAMEWITIDTALTVATAIPLVLVILRISRWQDAEAAALQAASDDTLTSA
jgi:hypothetical protein